MSIRSEINRITTAKSNLQTAIEGKGVPVPEGTTISGYASLVEQIPGGIEIPTVDFAAMGLTELVVDSDGDTFTITQEQFEQLAQQATTAPIKTNIAVNNGLITINFEVILNGWYTESYPPGGKTVEFYGIGYMEPDYGVDIAIKAVNSGVEYYLTGFAKTISNGAGENNVVIVDLNEILTRELPKITDEQYELLSSNNSVAIIHLGNYYYYRTAAVSGNLVFAASIVPPEGNNSDVSSSRIIVYSNKSYSVDGISGNLLPYSKSTDYGKFLMVGESGIPTWQSLPIYAGEVE